MNKGDKDACSRGKALLASNPRSSNISFLFLVFNGRKGGKYGMEKIRCELKNVMQLARDISNMKSFCNYIHSEQTIKERVDLQLNAMRKLSADCAKRIMPFLYL